MPYKRKPSETELNALAAELRALWRPGDIVGHWLRKYAHELRVLVHDDWSWAALADVLTRAGITYRTGHAWSADGLRHDVRRASRPLKRQLQIGGTSIVPVGAPTLSPARDAEPQFKLASLNTNQPQNASSLAPAEAPVAPSGPRFKMFTLKPQEPPRKLTPVEQEERAAIRKRFS
jgi:hypothetical protein